MDLLLAPDSREPCPLLTCSVPCRSDGVMVSIFSLKFWEKHSTPSYNFPKFVLGTAAANLGPRAREAPWEVSACLRPARSPLRRPPRQLPCHSSHDPHVEKLLTLPVWRSSVCTLAALDEGRWEAHAQGPSIPQARQVGLL